MRAVEVATTNGPIDEPRAAVMRFVAHAIGVDAAARDAGAKGLPWLSPERVRSVLEASCADPDPCAPEACFAGQIVDELGRPGQARGPA